MNFVKDNLFWVGLGTYVIVLVVLHLVFVAPTVKENETWSKQLQDSEAKLAQLSKDPSLPNQDWVKKAIEDKGKLEREHQKCLAYLKDREKAGKEPIVRGSDVDPVEFEYRYKVKFNKLKADARERGLEVDVNALKLIRWAAVPKESELEPAQKTFWLQTEVVELALKSDVRILQKLEYDPGQQRSDDLWHVAPFTLTVVLPYRSIPKLLNNLLTSDFYMNVYLLDVARFVAKQGLKTAGAGAGPGGPGGPGGAEEEKDEDEEDGKAETGGAVRLVRVVLSCDVRELRSDGSS